MIPTYNRIINPQKYSVTPSAPPPKQTPTLSKTIVVAKKAIEYSSLTCKNDASTASSFSFSAVANYFSSIMNKISQIFKNIFTVRQPEKETLSAAKPQPLPKEGFRVTWIEVGTQRGWVYLKIEQPDALLDAENVSTKKHKDTLRAPTVKQLGIPTIELPDALLDAENVSTKKHEDTLSAPTVKQLDIPTIELPDALPDALLDALTVSGTECETSAVVGTPPPPIGYQNTSN